MLNKQRFCCPTEMLRAYYLNGGDMLELARYQEVELPKAAGSEYDNILSAAKILNYNLICAAIFFTMWYNSHVGDHSLRCHGRQGPENRFWRQGNI